MRRRDARISEAVDISGQKGKTPLDFIAPAALRNAQDSADIARFVLKRMRDRIPHPRLRGEMEHDFRLFFRKDLPELFEVADIRFV